MFERWVGWKYFRIDCQPFRYGWRIWVYCIQYDGWHYAIHLGPLVFGYGDGVPPHIRDKSLEAFNAENET